MVLASRGLFSRSVVFVAVPRPVVARLVVSHHAFCLPLCRAVYRLARKAQSLMPRFFFGIIRFLAIVLIAVAIIAAIN